MSICSFHKVSYAIGTHVLLADVDWDIPAGARIALVGRNGAGKSSLLRLLEGFDQPDSGVIQKSPALKTACLVQDVLEGENSSVVELLTSGFAGAAPCLNDYFLKKNTLTDDELSLCYQEIEEHHAWDWITQIELMSAKLDIPLEASMSALSGGVKRRVFLAKALLGNPGLLLLDEPTNHLDLASIQWLENFLTKFSGTVLFVTHDRTFLEKTATEIMELERGHLYHYPPDFNKFLERRDERFLVEEKQSALFDKRLSQEETWIRQGVKARRTRNEGRVRALKKMRDAHKSRRSAVSKMNNIDISTERSGNIVLNAQSLYYSIDDKEIIRDCSLLVTRGDKIGILGPNGCGKTTFIRLLLGELTPLKGDVKLGTNVSIAYFDQLRGQLDDTKNVMENVADGYEFVTINGQRKHVASYLQDFLFSPDKFMSPVSSLSGGEKNRLLLAKLFAKPVNLLVLDEPTNDLDIETLELLESVLIDYPGTCMVISHDRSFLNQVVTSLLVYNGNHHFDEFIGNYEDYCLQSKEATPTKAIEAKKQQPVSAPVNRSEKLTYNEQQELKKLPARIESLEQKIQKAHEIMADSEFYKKSTDELTKFHKVFAEQEAELKECYSRWGLLEEKQ